MTGLAAGYGIGVIGEHGIRAYIKQSRIFVPLVLLLIFAEVLGLYGYVLSRCLTPLTANSSQINRCTDSQYENKGVKKGLYQYMYFMAMFLLYRCILDQMCYSD